MSITYPHIEERYERFYIQGSRVPVSSIVNAWNTGAAPESIRLRFPTLTLSEVYAAVAFYLDHRDIIDQHEVEDNAKYEADRQAQRAADPERYAELERRFAALNARDETAAL